MSSSSSRAPSKTLAPLFASSHSVHSCGQWLTPPTLGTKIMPQFGMHSARIIVSCPAPLLSVRCDNPRFSRLLKWPSYKYRTSEPVLAEKWFSMHTHCWETCLNILFQTIHGVRVHRAHFHRHLDRPGMTLATPGDAFSQPTVQTISRSISRANCSSSTIKLAALSHGIVSQIHGRRSCVIFGALNGYRIPLNPHNSIYNADLDLFLSRIPPVQYGVPKMRQSC